MYKNLKIGDKVRVVFDGGMDGTATGVVTEILKGNLDFRFTPEEDFWDDLSKCFHKRNESIIVHAHELKEIIQN